MLVNLLINYAITFSVSLALSLIIAPRAKWFLEGAGIVGIDQHKKGRPKLATSGGVIIAFGFLGSILGAIAVNTFLLPMGFDSETILVIISSVLIATFVGVLDDLNVKAVLQDNKGVKSLRRGLKQWQKPFFTVPAAIPLMVVGLGTYTMQIAGIELSFGIFYPLIIIPLALVFCSNAYNMLAGINGMETGMGVVAFAFLGLFSALNSRVEAAMIAFAALGAAAAFFAYNKYPAKILPGDSLTYMMGTLYVSIAVVGNIEKFAALCFAPWIVEFFLKARSRMKARSLGVLQEDGTLKSPYKSVYSLTHIGMNLGLGEGGIMWMMMGIELVTCIAAFGLVSLGIV